jgi:hypothetical protein
MEDQKEVKSKEFSLAETEKLKLENNILKTQNAISAQNNLKAEQNALVEGICKRVDQKVENITGLDIQRGIITFKDADNVKK